MNLLQVAFFEVVWYGAWWLCFIAVAFFFARYLRWVGVLIGVLVISVFIVCLDVNWIFQDMRVHPENGRDADFVFWLGVLLRVVFFNTLLSPVTLIGLWLSSRPSRDP